MRNLSIKNRIKLLTEFCETNKRMPRYVGSGQLESKLFSFVSSYKFNKTVQELKSRYRVYRSFDENYSKLIEFCETNNRLPTISNDANENKLRSFLNRHKDNPSLSEIITKYRKWSHEIKSKNLWISELAKFCEDHGRLPRSNSKGYESKLSNFRHRNMYNSEVKDITEKYKSKKFSKSCKIKIIDFIEYVTKHNKLPSIHNEGIERRLSSFAYRNKDNPEIMSLMHKYRKYRTLDDNIELLENWIEKNGRLPSCVKDDKEQLRLRIFMYRHRNNNIISELIKKYKRI